MTDFTGPIAYLTGEYPRATDTFIQREIFALRDLGVEVHTCSIRRTGPEHHVGPEQREEAARTFHVLEAAKRPLNLLRCHLRAMRRPGRYLSALRLALRCSPGGLRALAYQLFYFAEAAVLADHLERKGVRILHNHLAKSSCSVAMLMSQMSGIPYSFTLHGPDIFFEPITWRLDEKVARASFTACISHFARSQAMVFAKPEHWDRLHIVHCGIDPARYGPGAGRGGGETTLLFVGRLAAVKGVPVLFRAFSDLADAHPDLRLVLVGDGPERPALEAEAQARGLSQRVRFTGYLGQAEVAEMLGQADIFVLPSFAEGKPVVLMEAMAAGLPVVTTQIAGVPELVAQGQSGLLVPPGDDVALAQAIAGLLDQPQRREAMGQVGRARIEQGYTSLAEARKLAALLAEAAAR